ncbi:MAG: hypothetical protein GY711_27465 [bacterium]|nr:hypothetical protein [bacterium]
MPRRPLTIFFLAICAGVPLAQAALELARGERVQALDVFGSIEVQRLRRFEDDLREASFLHRHVTPHYNRGLFAAFGRGNERAVPMGDGRLQYGEDLDALTSREHWADAAADAVVDFRDQLAARGVQLVLVPVPPKALVDPRFERALERVPAFARFAERIDAAGVPAVDLPGDAEFLPRDTHWTPRTMAAAAAATAATVRERLGRAPQPTVEFGTRTQRVSGAGDLVGMLHWPTRFAAWPEMELEVEQVPRFVPDPAAEVLLLGDSFTRVFSDPDLGLGASAGFDAHLAKELGAGLDVIAVPGGGTLAVRETLARRSDGLAGKRVVVWQFSLRDLAADGERWRKVALAEGAVRAPERGRIVVEAEITEATRVPRGFDYVLLLSVYEYRVVRTLEGEAADDTLWIAHVSITDFEETPAATLAVGLEQRLTLEPLAEHYDLEETSWVDDTQAGREIWFAVEAVDL